MARVLLNGSDPNFAKARSDLIQELVRRGHQVHVSAPAFSDTSRQLLAEIGAIAHEMAISRTSVMPLRDLAYAVRMARLVRQVSPDQVLSYTIKPNIWGTLAAATAGAPAAMVVTGLGYAFLEPRSKRHRLVGKAARALYRLAIARANEVFFQNRDDWAEFRKSGCLPDTAKATIVNGSGVDLDRFGPSPLPDQPVFLMIARLLRAKGVLDYLRAARIASRDLPQARFLLAGPSEEGPDALAMSDVLREPNVHYLGELEDVRPAIERCSVFILPSHREGTPRVVLEAMAMARPIITTDSAGCRETTRNGVNGFLVPTGDPEGLAQAMVALGRDQGLRRRMGAESRRAAEQRYSVHDVNAALLRRLGL